MRQQYLEFKKKIADLQIANLSDSVLTSLRLPAPFIMAGPCAIESFDQLYKTAFKVQQFGAQVLRGGAFKPRTSPYSFQGLGLEGLKYLIEVKKAFNLPVITEIMDAHLLDHFLSDIDIIQIGSRNMQNYSLLKAVGQSQKPVMLKRGLSATMEEFLYAAEYIASHGNPHIILCERGIRTFEGLTRNTLDLSAVAIIKDLTRLPVIVDPSHACGVKSLIPSLSKAALASGADGLMVEVHINPIAALSDKEHALSPEEFHQLMLDLNLSPFYFQEAANA